MHLDNRSPAQTLAHLGSIIHTPPRIEFLPLFLEVVHCLLLFLARCSRVESDKETCRVELETLSIPIRYHRFGVEQQIEEMEEYR